MLIAFAMNLAKCMYLEMPKHEAFSNKCIVLYCKIVDKGVPAPVLKAKLE
jgi:hypothetical protein